MENPATNPCLLLTKVIAKPEFQKIDEELRSAGFRLTVARIDGKPIISIRLKEQENNSCHSSDNQAT